MKTLATVLLVPLLSSCASLAPYSTAYDSRAPAEWRDGSTNRCAFARVEPVCIRVLIYPEDANALEQFITAGIRQRLAEFESHCSEKGGRIEVQVSISPLECIDCGTPRRGPLIASAAVLAWEQSLGEPEVVEWVDERGGTLKNAAQRLGVAVGSFVSESLQQCKPPNNGLQPAAAGAIMRPPRLKPGR